MKYCSTSLEPTGYGTLRPPTDEDYSETWGEDALTKNNSDGTMTFEDYCMLNSCIDEGLQAIAKFNGFEKEWNELKEKFLRRNESMASKRFELMTLFARHRSKHKYHLDPMEGGHCRAAIFQANFCAPLNAEDGSISNLLTYNLKDFRMANLTPNQKIKMNDIGGKYNSLINEGAQNRGFFSESSSVHVMYLSDKNIPVPEFLEACQICSECHGRTKRNSASKDVFTEIAKCTVTFLNQMSDNGMIIDESPGPEGLFLFI